MIFKTLAISKIVYLALITNVSKVIETSKNTKKKLWQNSRPKIKHKTSNTFKDSDLTNVDINLKVISLQCSWVKKLYDKNFHEWKVIPLHLIRITFGQNFKFHSNFSCDTRLLTSFLYFIKIFFASGANTLLFLQICFPVFYLLFYGTIKISQSPQRQYISNIFLIII